MKFRLAAIFYHGKLASEVWIGCVHKTFNFLFSPDIWRDRKKKTKIAQKEWESSLSGWFFTSSLHSVCAFSKSSTWVGWLAVATFFYIWREPICFCFLSVFYTTAKSYEKYFFITDCHKAESPWKVLMPHQLTATLLNGICYEFSIFALVLNRIRL